jgi:hypothetical protein
MCGKPGKETRLVTHREGAILQSPCPLIRLSVCPSVHTFVTDISASTGRNRMIWVVHQQNLMVDYYDNMILPKIVSVNIILLLKRIQHILQVRILPILQSPCPLIRLSVCPSVHTFVTDISASTGRNEFICTVSPFQVYRTSTSCLQCDLEFFMFAVIKKIIFYLLKQILS